MSDFAIYDLDQVSVVICGIPIEGGAGEDGFIEIDQPSADFTTVVGADGDVARSKTNDHRGNVKLTLLQTAKANNLLTALNNLDKSASNGAGVGPFLVKDLQGTSLYAGEHSWIAKPPAVTFAKGVEARVWEIEVADLTRVDGGN